MSAALAEPLMEPLYGPVWTAFGQVFEFQHESLKISSLTWFGSHEPRLFSWASIASVDVRWDCFLGTLTIRHKVEGPIEYKFPPHTLLQTAGHIIAKLQQCKLAGEAEKVMERHSGQLNAGLTSKGVIVKKRTAMCHWTGAFVTWSDVVSADLQRSCCGSTITLRTSIEESNQSQVFRLASAQSLGVSSTSVPSRESSNSDNEGSDCTPQDIMPPLETVEQDLSPPEDPRLPLPIFLTLSFRGEAKAMDDVFGVITRLVAQASNADPSNAGALGSVKSMTLTTLGVEVTNHSSRRFLPWRSVADADWVSRCCQEPAMVITDSLGGTTSVPGVEKDGLLSFFTVFRKMAKLDARMLGVDGKAREALPGTGIRMDASGVHFKNGRHLAWADMDDIEMDVDLLCSHIFVLQGEDRHKVASDWFFMHECMSSIFRKMLARKFGLDLVAKVNGRHFGGSRGAVNTSLLTDSWLRLAAKTGRWTSTVMLLDLDAVRGSNVVSDTALGVHTRDLVSRAACRIGKAAKTETLIIQLARGDDAYEIKDDLTKRSARRKCSMGWLSAQNLVE